MCRFKRLKFVVYKEAGNIVQYVLINTAANAIGRVKRILLNQDGTVDRIHVKYKGDKQIYSLRPKHDGFQIIKIEGLWNIVKWHIL